jgi:hypothetical protein
MSGLLGGLESTPLPASWRERTRMTYPFGLPEQRLINVDFARGWFRTREIPVVDLQSDTGAGMWSPTRTGRCRQPAPDACRCGG